MTDADLEYIRIYLVMSGLQQIALWKYYLVCTHILILLRSLI
nr:MAG TPA: hypothetical protein [Crassvirales sp.]